MQNFKENPNKPISDKNSIPFDTKKYPLESNSLANKVIGGNLGNVDDKNGQQSSTKNPILK